MRDFPPDIFRLLQSVRDTASTKPKADEYSGLLARLSGRDFDLIRAAIAAAPKPEASDELIAKGRELNREGLILEVTEEIWRVMKRRKITKAELAQRIGCGKSHITQLLNGGRNMTLRTLADICTALEHKPRFRLADNRETK